MIGLQFRRSLAATLPICRLKTAHLPPSWRVWSRLQTALMEGREPSANRPFGKVGQGSRLCVPFTGTWTNGRRGRRLSSSVRSLREGVVQMPLLQAAGMFRHVLPLAFPCESCRLKGAAKKARLTWRYLVHLTIASFESVVAGPQGPKSMADAVERIHVSGACVVSMAYPRGKSYRPIYLFFRGKWPRRARGR